MDQQQLLDLALDSGPIGTFRWNQQSGELIWNRHHFLMMGMDPSVPPTYALFRERVHPDDVPGLEADIERARISRSRHFYQFRVIRPDGSLRFLQGSGLFFYDAQGRPEWMAGVLTDVTEVHVAQALLAEKERQLATVLEHSPDIYARFDCQLRHLYLSSKIEAITGLHPREFIGKTNRELGMPPYLCAAWDSAMQQAIRSKCQTIVQFEFPAQSGAVQYFESRIVPEMASDGQVEALLCITTDVTLREQMFRTLRATENRLIRADRTKDEFLATLAHELKTPLAAIAGGIQILQLSQADEKSGQLLDLMARQTRHLCDLVEELWDVSSIVQQKAAFKWEVVNLSQILDDAGALCKAHLDEARHELVFDVPAAPLMVSGDRRRLLQVFTNLLSNAIKYTPSGGSLRIAVAHEEPHVCVEVRDNGIGIPEERLSQLFDIFFQVPAKDDSPLRGLGIGLAVVKRLVEMHHGTIEVRSNGLQKGTSVLVRLPAITNLGSTRTGDR